MIGIAKTLLARLGIIDLLTRRTNLDLGGPKSLGSEILLQWLSLEIGFDSCLLNRDPHKDGH